MKIKNITMGLALLNVVAFADVSMSLNVSESGSVSEGGWKYYTINGGASSIKLYNLSSDLDMHVKSGSRPTANSWDCRPYEGGTSEEVCTVSPNEVIYIGIKGFTSGSFSLVASGSGGGTTTPTPSPTGNSLLHESGSVSDGGWKYYTINGGATSVKLHNLSSDLDLHVKSGSRPTANNWDCRPYEGGTSDETCQVSPNEVIYIGVYGFTSGSYTIDVSGSGGGGVSPNPNPVSTVATQVFSNAVSNIGKTRGQVTWNGNSQTGTWANSQYTYCARFVRMCFGEPGKYNSAIAMYNHFNNLRLIQSFGTPPKGAVLFYASHNENGYYGHTGIADGNGYIYSATSHWRGVTKLRTHAFAARYLGYVTASQFKQSH